MLGLTGTSEQVAATWKQAKSVLRRNGGVSTGTLLGSKWAEKRFSGVYLRNSLWAAGYAVDTMETSVPWRHSNSTMLAMEAAGREALARLGERCHAYTHLSHVYGTGSSVYSTFVFRIGADQAGTLQRWTALKRAVSEAIVANGGTISHQHGVGRDHAPYLPAEKGALGMSALVSAFDHFDPQGVLANDNLTGPPA
jgi:alkyldihydroxyacetonephosphate synthase